MRTTLPVSSGLFLWSRAWLGLAAGGGVGLGLTADLEGPALQVPGFTLGLGFQIAEV